MPSDSCHSKPLAAVASQLPGLTLVTMPVVQAAHAYDAMMVVLKAYARAAAPKKGPQLLAAMMETNTKGESCAVQG